MNKLSKLAATLPLLAACAEPPTGTEPLTDEQHDAVQATIEAEGNKLELAAGLVPYLDTKWNLEGDPVKGSDVLVDGLNGIKDRLLERLEEDRIVVGFDEYWQTYISLSEDASHVGAAAHGVETDTEDDDYIIIPADEETSTGLSMTSGNLAHEELHFDYGMHKEVVPVDEKGFRDEEKMPAYIERNRDTPYLASELAEAGDILNFYLYLTLSSYDGIQVEIANGISTPQMKYDYYEKIKGEEESFLRAAAWKAFFSDNQEVFIFTNLGLSTEDFQAYIDENMNEWKQKLDDYCNEIMANLLRDYPDEITVEG